MFAQEELLDGSFGIPVPWSVWGDVCAACTVRWCFDPAERRKEVITRQRRADRALRVAHGFVPITVGRITRLI